MKRTVYFESPCLNDAIEHALTDLRIVKQMLQVAAFFNENIQFARENKIEYFIIDYDENNICKNIVNTVNEKYKKIPDYNRRFYDIHDIEYMYYESNHDYEPSYKATIYIATLIVRRFLPDDIVFYEEKGGVSFHFK